MRTHFNVELRLQPSWNYVLASHDAEIIALWESSYFAGSYGKRHLILDKFCYREGAKYLQGIRQPFC